MINLYILFSFWGFSILSLKLLYSQPLLVVNGFVEVKYNFDNDIQTLTTFNENRDGRIDDGNRHIIDIIFYLKFAKIYLDNKSFGDQVMGKVFPKTDFYIGKENNKNISNFEFFC